MPSKDGRPGIYVELDYEGRYARIPRPLGHDVRRAEARELGWGNVEDGDPDDVIMRGVTADMLEPPQIVAPLRVWPGWQVVYTLDVQDGQIVASRVTVEPTGEDVPIGGIPARLLQDVRIDSELALFQDRMIPHARRQLGDRGIAELFGDDEASSRFLRLAAQRVGPKPGRRVSDEDLVRILILYNQAAKGRQRGSGSLWVGLAERTGYSVDRLQELVREAKTRNLAGAGRPGKAGAPLTDKGREIAKGLQPQVRQRKGKRKGGST